MPNGVQVIKKIWKCNLSLLSNLHFGQVSFQTMYFQTHESLCFWNYFNFHLGIVATHNLFVSPVARAQNFPEGGNGISSSIRNVAHSAGGTTGLTVTPELHCVWLRDAPVRILVNVHSSPKCRLLHLLTLRLFCRFPSSPRCLGGLASLFLSVWHLSTSTSWP